MRGDVIELLSYQENAYRFEFGMRLMRDLHRGLTRRFGEVLYNTNRVCQFTRKTH